MKPTDALCETHKNDRDSSEVICSEMVQKGTLVKFYLLQALEKERI